MEEFIKLQNVIGYIGNGQYCISVKDLCVWYGQFQAVSFIRFWIWKSIWFSCSQWSMEDSRVLTPSFFPSNRIWEGHH
jgi:hypothetical protein